MEKTIGQLPNSWRFLKQISLFQFVRFWAEKGLDSLWPQKFWVRDTKKTFHSARPLISIRKSFCMPVNLWLNWEPNWLPSDCRWVAEPSEPPTTRYSPKFGEWNCPTITSRSWFSAAMATTWFLVGGLEHVLFSHILGTSQHISTSSNQMQSGHILLSVHSSIPVAWSNPWQRCLRPPKKAKL